MIGWHSRRQSAIAGEIVERELLALNRGLRKGLAIRNLLEEIELLESESQDKVYLYSDSKTAREIAKKGPKGAKHYDRQSVVRAGVPPALQLDVIKVFG